MRNFIVLILLSLTFGLYAQGDCEVKVEELTGTYKGKCKDGLAHGKGIAKGIDTYSGKFKFGYPEGRGTYTYASGDVYTGKMVKGRREGKGKYEYVINGEKSLKEGYWEDDVYVGPKKIKPYKVIRKRSVERYAFSRIDDGDDIKIELLKAGRTNHTVEDLMIYGSSGNEQIVTSNISWKNVNFPFTGNVRYKTSNKINTSIYEVYFEFEILKEGNWNIILHN